jgi:hypothetical protein
MVMRRHILTKKECIFVLYEDRQASSSSHSFEVVVVRLVEMNDRSSSSSSE